MLAQRTHEGAAEHHPQIVMQMTPRDLSHVPRYICCCCTSYTSWYSIDLTFPNLRLLKVSPAFLRRSQSTENNAKMQRNDVVEHRQNSRSAANKDEGSKLYDVRHQGYAPRVQIPPAAINKLSVRQRAVIASLHTTIKRRNVMTMVRLRGRLQHVVL